MMPPGVLSPTTKFFSFTLSLSLSLSLLDSPPSLSLPSSFFLSDSLYASRIAILLSPQRSRSSLRFDQPELERAALFEDFERGA